MQITINTERPVIMRDAERVKINFGACLVEMTHEEAYALSEVLRNPVALIDARKAQSIREEMDDRAIACSPHSYVREFKTEGASVHLRTHSHLGLISYQKLQPNGKWNCISQRLFETLITQAVE